jgi:hypothetical protein
MEKKAAALDEAVDGTMQSFSVNASDTRSSGQSWKCEVKDEVAMCHKQ